MFSIDTNLLVYAHNTGSEFHEQAITNVTQIINERDLNGQHTVCLSTQVLTEFFHVITLHRIENPLSINEALSILQDYKDAGIPIIHQQETQFQTFLEILETTTTRRKTFDVALAATLKDNQVSGLYTVNVNDFVSFDFLEVINPLLPSTDSPSLSE
jgi:predicted nucleic acid-binding protein